MGSDVVVLSRVSSGWTGTLIVTGGGGLSITVTPDARTSPGRVWEQLVDALNIANQSATNVGWVDSSLFFHVTSTSFGLAASGTTQTRLNLSASYVGVTTVSSSSAVANLLAPKAIGENNQPAAYKSSTPAADGVLGGGIRQQPAMGSLDLYSTAYLSNTLVLEGEVDDGGTYDVFLNGRVLTRVRSQDLTRTRWGLRADKAVLGVGTTVVAL